VPDYPAIEWFEILLRQRRKHLDDLHQAKGVTRSSAHKQIDNCSSLAEDAGNDYLSTSSYSRYKSVLTESGNNSSQNRDIPPSEVSDHFIIDYLTTNHNQSESTE
jgi:hypothetical protein